MSFESEQARWQPPEELRHSGPRRVRLTGQGIALICVGAGIVALAVTIGPMAYYGIRGQIERDRLLRREGVAASGVVTRAWKRSGKTPTPMLAYRFIAPGGEFTGQSEMRSEVWRDMRPGDQVAVRYLPARPEVNAPAEGVPNPPPEWLAWLPLLMFVWPPILFWFLIRGQWRLLSEGVPVQAVVTRIRRSKGTSVYYEFRTPPGEAVKGRSEVSGRGAPEVGAHVCVLYNPDNPRKNTFYPMQMVKLRRD